MKPYSFIMCNYNAANRKQTREEYQKHEVVSDYMLSLRVGRCLFFVGTNFCGLG